MRKTFFTLVISSIFLISNLNISYAALKTFEKDYTYQASEIDSKVTARAIALEQVKRLVLEELGTYLMSETEVKDFRLTKDKVVTLTAGVVQTEILNEKWDGEKYYLRARIKAEPNEVAAAVDRLRKDTQNLKELEEARKKADEAFKEIERLKKELKTVKADKSKQKEYAKAADILSATDWFYKGKQYYSNKDYDKTIEAYSSAIALDPNYAADYNNRGIAYQAKEQYDRAIEDYTRAIELDPNNDKAYDNRGNSYNKKGQYDRAIEDYNKAIELNPDNAKAYYNRGIAYAKKGKYDRAIEDNTKAIQLDPNYDKAYNNRGNAYKKTGDMGRAISDFQKACDLGSKKSCENLEKVLKNR